MSKTIKIELLDPIETPQGIVTSISFREPKARDFAELGEPFQFVRLPNGTHYVVEHDNAIRGYIERCVMAPVDPVTLGGASLADAMRIKDEFLFFFGRERARTSNAPAT